MHNNFSFGGLEERLRELRFQGFEFSTDFTLTSKPGLIFIRHDIDLSIKDALDVARLEANVGVQATFFLLASGDLYNICSRDTRAAIQELVGLGHQIGLHFDISAGPQPFVSARLEQEISILETVSDSSVRFMSQHKPGTYGFLDLTHDRVIDVRDQVSAKQSAVGYCSDSGGFWSHGDYASRHLNPDFHSLQLLLHPVWWSRPESKHPFDVLSNFISRADESNQHYVARNVNRYATATASGGGRGAWPEGIR